MGQRHDLDLTCLDASQHELVAFERCCGWRCIEALRVVLGGTDIGCIGSGEAQHRLGKPKEAEEAARPSASTSTYAP